jgi:TNF receptor-associated factor 4
MALETVADLRRENSKLQETLDKRVTKFKITHPYSCEEFTSPSFYTSPGGYRMVLKVDFNKGSFGVYIRLMHSTMNGYLKWPFTGAVDITLLNQLENKNHLTSRVHFKSAKAGHTKGFRKFISYSKLVDKNIQYLKDDTLYFKVSANVRGHNPWLDGAMEIQSSDDESTDFSPSSSSDSEID